jgi:hypothetical protein
MEFSECERSFSCEYANDRSQVKRHFYHAGWAESRSGMALAAALPKTLVFSGV